MPVSSAIASAAAGMGKFTWGRRIPMRDGATLNAILYLPLEAKGPVPTIFRLTPYAADTFYLDGAVFAARGYAYVCADVRGRGDSDGPDYVQIIRDGQDGYDCVEWIAGQPWSDGCVVMYGSSYSGTNQWLVAALTPPALKAIAPSGVSLVGFDYPAPGGALLPTTFQILTLTGGRSLYLNLSADVDAWNDIYAELWRSNARLTSLSEMTGNPSPFFNLLATTNPPHRVFEACDLGDSDYAKIEIPVLSATGLADQTCPGTIEAHRRFLRNAGTGAASKSRLLLGPWDHLGLESGAPRVGELQFGAAARVDVRALKLDWYDWVLGRGPRPPLLEQPLAYYLAGAEKWRSASGPGKLPGEDRTFFLSSDGGANDVFRSGQLLDKPNEGEQPDTFLCDPSNFDAVAIELIARDIPPPIKENAPGIRVGRVFNDLSTVLSGADPTNDAFVASMHDFGVVYHSAPLAQAMDVMGHPKLSLWLSVDTPDTDLAFLLSVVPPNSTASIALSSDFLRLRHRNGPDRDDLVTPSEPFLLERPVMWFASRRLAAGSRIRLAIRYGASIRKEKNLNTSEPVNRQTPDKLQIARVTVYHDSERQSRLVLPATPAED